MTDRETRRTPLRKILESYNLVFDPSGAQGGEIRISGMHRTNGEFKRMRVHGCRKFPGQVVRNIRAKFGLTPPGVSDDEFYGRV